jgi:NitT/TauT family transport system substrate-binding protein
MRLRYFPFIIIIVALIVAAPLYAQSKKVRFSVSAISIAEVPFKVAQVKGFYRDEGLNVETILIRGAVGLQALVGGSVDYTSASGATIAAAVRGIPVKLVFIGSAKPQFDLMAQPQIRSVQDLRGKLIGISSRGGAIDLLTQAILQKSGLMPNKDVTSIVVGGQEETALALRTGRIAAGLFTAPRPLILEREGFTRLAYSGDYMATYPTGGIGVTDEKIKADPAEVLAFVKGSLRGLQYAKQNRADAAKIIGEYLGLKDASLSEQILDVYVNRISAAGSADESWMRGAIDFTQKSLGGADKDVAPARVFDFSFAQKAAASLR